MSLRTFACSCSALVCLSIVGASQRATRATMPSTRGPAALEAPGSADKLTIANLGTDGGGSSFAGDDLYLFEVSEAIEGLDLNGDGDVLDRFYRAYDLRSETLTNLDVSHPGVPGVFLVVDGRDAAYRSDESGELCWFELGSPFQDGLLALHVPESAQGGADLNGDGDASDVVLHVIDLNPE